MNEGRVGCQRIGAGGMLKGVVSKVQGDSYICTDPPESPMWCKARSRRFTPETAKRQKGTYYTCWLQDLA